MLLSWKFLTNSNFTGLKTNQFHPVENSLGWCPDWNIHLTIYCAKSYGEVYEGWTWNWKSTETTVRFIGFLQSANNGMCHIISKSVVAFQWHVGTIYVYLFFLIKLSITLVSNVFEKIWPRCLQPVWRPAGFDAGPFLQAVVVSCQLWVTLHTQAEKKVKGMDGICVKLQFNFCVNVQTIIQHRYQSLLGNLMLLPKTEGVGNVRKDGHVSQREVFSCQATTGLQNKAELKARC